MSKAPLFALQRLRLPQSDAEMAERVPHAALCNRFTLGQSGPAPAKAVWKARP
jgi:hypothetical protein